MATETRPVPETELPDGYPFHIGTRVICHRDDAGEIVDREYVPLTEEDYLHPDEEDRQMLAEAHYTAAYYLLHALKIGLCDRPELKVFCDHRIDWQIEGLKPLGPDVVVFDNFTKPWDPYRGTLPVRDFDAKAVAAFEVTSPSTRHIDFEAKFEAFADVGIPYYLIVDTAEPNGEPRIRGYRLSRGQYRPMHCDPKLGYMVPPLKMYFRWENDRVIAADEDGHDIPDGPELAALYEAETVRANAETVRANAETVRANAETVRANAETARADALAAELAELKVKLTDAQ